VHGRLALDLPAGDHHLALVMAGTALQWLSGLIALAGVAACVLAVLVDRAAPVTASQPALSPQPWAQVLLAVALVLGVRWAAQGRVTPLYRTRLTETGLAGAAVPVTAAFENQLRLLGADLRAARVASGGAVDVTLYWQALQPLAVDYSITTRLVDQAGALVAQHDAEHPGALPTSSWPVDRYACRRPPSG
jgi:hypothetical protein